MGPLLVSVSSFKIKISPRNDGATLTRYRTGYAVAVLGEIFGMCVCVCVCVANEVTPGKIDAKTDDNKF